MCNLQAIHLADRCERSGQKVVINPRQPWVLPESLRSSSSGAVLVVPIRSRLMNLNGSRALLLYVVNSTRVVYFIARVKPNIHLCAVNFISQVMPSIHSCVVYFIAQFKPTHE